MRPGKVDPKTLKTPVIFFFIAAAIYCVAAYGFGEFTRPMGFIMLAMFVAYMVANVRQMKNAPAEEHVEEEELIPLSKTLILLVAGAAVIAERTGLSADIAAAQVIVTGEGRFDEQSLHGKVIGALAERARRHRVPIVVLAGQITVDEATLTSAGIAAAHSLVDYAGSVRRALGDAENQLVGLARRVATDLAETQLGPSSHFGNTGPTGYR